MQVSAISEKPLQKFAYALTNQTIGITHSRAQTVKALEALPA